MTTAFLTLRLMLPGGFRHEVIPFDQIIAAVAEGRFDAGLIIHEGQLTFQNQGLHLVADLGVWWQEKTGLPIHPAWLWAFGVVLVAAALAIWTFLL